MRLTFLGTGTSFGVPQVGCGCAVCRSDDPRDLWCPACGETWRETDGRARGRAWAAWCAWLDRQERDEQDERTRVKRERDERRMAEMRRRDGTDR